VVTGLLRAQGIGLGLTPTAAETRACTTLLDRGAGEVTELIEEGPAVTPSERKAFVRSALRRVAACRALALCGNLPPGVEPGFYVSFADAARRAGRPVAIDCHRDALLAVLPQRPLLAKLNAHELGHTFARRCDSEEQVRNTARLLLDRGAQWVLVTRGGAPAILAGPDGASWRLTPPSIKPLNPIGSGDCVTAGILHAWLGGASMPEAARAGLACGTANALTAIPACFTLSDVRRMRRLTRLQELSPGPRRPARTHADGCIPRRRD
jgi:tagatose 6-phosphate kinase